MKLEYPALRPYGHYTVFSQKWVKHYHIASDYDEEKVYTYCSGYIHYPKERSKDATIDFVVVPIEDIIDDMKLSMMLRKPRCDKCLDSVNHQ